MASAFSFLGVLVSAPLLLAQSATTTGAVQGTVEDGTGATIPAVSISLRSLSSGATRTVTSSDTGHFQITGLPVGPYALRLEKEGLMPVSIQPLAISIG